ncbi:hypothetical protein BX600DRAFT_430407 [Xylariales sp. PMI_506]|nr:hypothetical protein BX600DRAFT_430407 [Xylariales sp. PMI_506]
MFYVLFAGSVRSDKSALSDQYYNTLQPILHQSKGFIEELPLGDPTRPNASLLFARFATADSLARWRNHPQHLRIMHHARHGIFEQYRVTVGTDTPRSIEAAKAEGRVVVVYQRSATQELCPESVQLPLVAKSRVFEMATDVAFYNGENHFMWVVRLKTGSDVDEFEASLERVPGDAVHRIHVVRDYTKADRDEAPVGIDKAEAEAGARI